MEYLALHILEDNPEENVCINYLYDTVKTKVRNPLNHPQIGWGKIVIFLHLLRLSSSLQSVYKYYNTPQKEFCSPMINSGERTGETRKQVCEKMLP